MGRVLGLLFLLCLSAPAAALENQLRNHPSPYLAMHGADPVAWQEWDEATVALARETGNKLLFVSSGYFACHWCHVMQRESYRDEEIAALLNRDFIPVKLDRELHGALDAHLIDFVESTQGQAGWPLNVFLTPEGYPLIGVTYLPPDRFRRLLTRLRTAWVDDRGRLRSLARRTTLQLAAEGLAAESPALSSAQLHGALLDRALALADLLEGGFGQQSRFPMAPQLLALLERQVAMPDPRLAEFLSLTLDRMAGEGMRDHLAGGFFRYTVDPGWQVPHFEKMLYTQALLAEVYLTAAQVFERPDYATVAHDTLKFVVREMRGRDGGYVASFSAVDDVGEEGGMYLWSIDRLHELLGEQDTALARRYWRMFDVPPFDAGHLPRRGEGLVHIAAALNTAPTDIRQRVERIRTRLLEDRATRGLPVDDKQLAGWNGLLLAALARGAQQLDDADLAAAAHQLKGFLRDRLWDGSRLLRSRVDGREVGRASIEDYAYVAYGMARYAQLSGAPEDRTFVAALVQAAWDRYHGVGGWRLDEQPLIPGMAESPALRDGALPAPSAVLQRVALASADPGMVEQAVASAQAGRGLVQREPFWFSQHLAVLAGLPRAPGPPAVPGQP